MLMSQSENRILNSLPQNIFAALEPHLKTESLNFGDVVAETDQLVTCVYFPHRCVISLVVEMDVGDMVETAMVGRDGVVNATSALDGKMALHKAIVQIAGDAAVIDPDTLRNIAHEFDPFQSILIRHAGATIGGLQREPHGGVSDVPLAAAPQGPDAIEPNELNAGIIGPDARRSPNQRHFGRWHAAKFRPH
jgi:hypothetical protein